MNLQKMELALLIDNKATLIVHKAARESDTLGRQRCDKEKIQSAL